MGRHSLRRDRRDLARLLGVEITDLATRREAAEFLGYGEATLKRWREDGPAYFRRGEKGSALYPLKSLKEFRQFKAGELPTSAVTFGHQEWPLERDRPSMVEIVKRTDQWQAELEYARAHDLITRGLAFCPDRHREDAEILAAFHRGETVGIERVGAIARAIFARDLTLDEPWGRSAQTMIIQKWAAALDREAKWLAGDLTDVPNRRPALDDTAATEVG